MCSDSYNIVLRKYKSSKYSVSLVKRKKAIAPMYEARNEQLPSAVVLLHLVNVNSRRWLGDKTFNRIHKCLWRVLKHTECSKKWFRISKKKCLHKKEWYLSFHTIWVYGGVANMNFYDIQAWNKNASNYVYQLGLLFTEIKI